MKRCLSALDNGKHGLVFPSGCAAASAVLLMLKAGDHIVSSCETYGGTRTQFLHYTKIQGIEIDFVDSTDMKLIESAIKSNTRVKLFFHISRHQSLLIILKPICGNLVDLD